MATYLVHGRYTPAAFQGMLAADWCRNQRTQHLPSMNKYLSCHPQRSG